MNLDALDTVDTRDPVLKDLIHKGQVTDPHSAKGKLMRAAAHLFKSKGYERTTVRELGAAVGIQSGSLFHHFKSKEEILLAVMEETIIINMARMNAALSDSKDAGEKLHALIRCELDSVHTDTGEAMSVLVYEWRSLSPDKQKYVLQLRDEYETLWLNTIEECKQQGLIQHDAFILRRLLTGAIGWTTTWYRPDGNLSLEDLAKQTLLLAIK
ncbi:TetR/AcrR family transcriptional regulator [Bermanella marisrubri]|uniref:Probable transcriptional regulator n=1 Tax=Bermanella marisrubri TaxID=207949 RepID=Q1N585_9GAMM|nr:TetR/AcrR family transcriptional regulator [Bermanella marisrubri]EAT13193.1 probable transcriptional regulator [Oceanobacter sp. RED65] [Bermanella marisrubri]QIZ83963.1 TetR/AcrR family transcriptional regulator [Bermanella marisrubri]